MITLPELPRLAWPTTAVRVSNLTGEQADHATAMLARGLAECRPLGLDRVLLTCDSGNEASRRGILANGGISWVEPAARITSGSPSEAVQRSVEQPRGQVRAGRSVLDHWFGT